MWRTMGYINRHSSPPFLHQPLNDSLISIMHLHFLLLFPVLYLVVRFYTFLTSPLRSVPGPFWTRLTKLWYFNRVRNAHFERENIHLHQRYGPIFRIGPDHYSISDPAAVKTVYGTGSKFVKSAWYDGWKHPDPDKWTLFPDRNVKRHGNTVFFWNMFVSLRVVSN